MGMMFNLFKKKEELISPVSGSLIPITEVNDQVFSKKLMGDGFAILPEEGDIYAPMSGTISFYFPTKHALGIKTENEVEVLIHMGLDTVELQGEGFISCVNEGQKVKQGEKLAIMDLKAIKAKGYDCTVIIIFPKSTVESLETYINIKHHQKITLKLQTIE